MEGMVCKEIRAIQRTHSSITGLQCNTERWGRELVTCLLEVTHGQWLYRNVQVHDRIPGTLATQQKEELQMEIERQQELGMEGLLDDDCYLAECNLGDLENTSGIKGRRIGFGREYGLSQSQQSRTIFRECVFRNNSCMAARYPGESPGRRVALSSGSDCDAVWPVTKM